MPRSRSRSPRRERKRSRSRDRERDRSRDRDRDRSDRDKSDRDKPDRDKHRRPRRSRSRSKERRRRSRSTERRHDRDRGDRGGRDRRPLRVEESDSDDDVIIFSDANRPTVTEEKIKELPEEDQDLMRLMGFTGFETTKDKQVIGNDVYSANICKKRRYRQYMNRKGGFNRPLDFLD